VAGRIERWAGAAQPEIVDGVRGTGLPVYSVFGMDTDFTGKRISTIHGYSSTVQLVVTVPDRAPYTIDLLRWMEHDKFPIAGAPLPLTVERDDPTKIRIEWDEVPDVDAMIRAGATVFTDPDTAEANLRAAMTTSVQAVIENVDAQADRIAQMIGSSLPPGQVKSILQELRGDVDGGSTTQATRLPPDRPSARVIAHTRRESDDDGTALVIGRSQMLLSVSVPGRPRYGYHWHGMMHTRRFFAEWSDLPIEIKRNGHVDIDWREMDTVMDIAFREVKRAGAAMETKIAGLQDGSLMAERMQSLVNAAAPDPEQRAKLQAQFDEAMQRPWANPLAPPPSASAASAASAATPTPAAADPAALLEQLAQLHAAGALTDDEYAAERQRVLDQI